MRVALYARVSTEEQVRHGLSVAAQLDNLRAWATENGHTVVDEYVELGVSARKPPIKRPQLQRLLGDLGKIELIAFTKLDRWTRNVKGYYDVQEKLDAAKVSWTAIHESYETVSAAGRFTVNVLLAVAESEADRTGERIKVVKDHKVQRGEFLGSILPLGLEVAGKKVVPSAEADLARECFRVFRETGSVYQARAFVEEHGHPISWQAVHRLLQNPMYCGRFRGNDDYCAPIVSVAEWEAVQEMLRGRSVRKNQTHRVYIFSGLIRCAECGRRMAGAWATHGHDNYMYRCNAHHMDKSCSNKRHLRESEMEAWLLDNVVAELKRVTAAMQRPKKAKKPVDAAAIKKRLGRLKDLYLDGFIDKAEYAADRAELLEKLSEQSPPARDLSAVSSIVLAHDFREQYNTLSREEKLTLWRSVIDHVVADDKGNYHIYFLP